MLAQTPPPPYYAVIFTSIRTAVDDGYNSTAEKLRALVEDQPGFLGVESAGEDLEITVSYWKDLESVRGWKMNMEHLQAQKDGRAKWYSDFKIRICKVEREYGMNG